MCKRGKMEKVAYGYVREQTDQVAKATGADKWVHLCVFPPQGAGRTFKSGKQGGKTAFSSWLFPCNCELLW